MRSSNETGNNTVIIFYWEKKENMIVYENEKM